jgi:hypothetical protein
MTLYLIGDAWVEDRGKQRHLATQSPPPRRSRTTHCWDVLGCLLSPKESEESASWRNCSPDGHLEGRLASAFARKDYAPLEPFQNNLSQ